MKTIIALLLTPLLLLAKEPAPKLDAAKLKHPASPMLWTVEGNGLKKTSYLFGSIHVSDPRVTTLHPLAEEAFNKSDTVATEVDLSMKNQLAIVKDLMRTDDKTLDQAIGADLSKQLNAELAHINPQFTSAAFQTFKTWAMTLTVATLKEALEQKEALDQQLWNRAEKAGKSVWALETNQQQLAGFNQLTDEEQNTLLKDTLKGLAEARAEKTDIYKELVDAYVLGDIAAINKESNKSIEEASNPATVKKFHHLLLSKRNDIITENIHKKIQAEPTKAHFMVAGTLHYVGENNVVDLLKKQGYKVTKIK